MRKKKRNIILYIITFSWLFEGLVLFYKKCISPLLPHVCKYYPTCSDYMLQSIRTHGVFKGIGLGTRRLFRCVPWAKGGYDPVLPNRRNYKWLY